MKFKEAFSILSEAVVSLANSFFLFNVPTFPDSEMKSFNKGQKVFLFFLEKINEYLI